MPQRKELLKLKNLFSLTQKKQAGQPQPPNVTNIIGYFDVCEPNLIKGWVIDKTATDKQLEVDIVVDGVPIIRMLADKFREDLVAERIADGNHGFEWLPSDSMFENQKCLIEVREVSSGYILQGSPKILVGRHKFVKKQTSDWFHLLGAEVKYPFQLILALTSIEKCSAADQRSLVAIILNSGLFDSGYYLQQLGEEMGIVKALEHFLFTGAARRLQPMLGFDSKEYRELNTDIQELSDAGCFVHYVLSGRAEKRYYNRSILKRDAAILRSSQEFDVDWYSSFAPNTGELTPHEHYLAEGWRKGFPPNRRFDFDYEFYLNCYSDARQSGVPPFLHYVLLKNGRVMSLENANKITQHLLVSTDFDAEYYRARYSKYIPEGSSEILHYYCEGERLKFEPNDSFSADYYSCKYSDLSSQVNLLEHYALYGKKENRKVKFDPSKYVHIGECAWNPDKPTILVVCHEASRTGAPILGLRLVEQLNQRANVISWLGKKGPLWENFRENSTALISGDLDHADSVWMVRELKKIYQLQGAILNSVVTSDIAVVLSLEKVPSVALVHEYADYMGSAVLQMMIIANRVVYPAQGVKESADALSYKAFGMSRTNAVVRHQGRCVPPPGEGGNTYTREKILLRLGITEDEQKPAVVMGCGWVHMRKGVEYFIEAARYCKELIDRPVRFIWVGGGYLPDTDLHYSAWLKSQLIHSGLEEEVVFFEETDDLGPFFELADVFFLSSRLDPFPNVAIDAVLAEVPVVAFERASGFSEFIHEHPTVGVAVPFLDVKAAAKVIHEYVMGERARPARDNAILKQLSFAGYANFVWEECQAAIAHQKAVDEETELLIESKLMDVDFFKSAQPNWQSVLTPEYIYVSMWGRGIKTAKSRVGFNDLLAEGIATHISSDTQSITPLANVLKSSASPLTHKTIFIDPNEASKPFGNTLTVALHIHAYYIEALPALLRRLGDVGRRVLLCITTDTGEKAKAIKSIADSLSFDVNVVVMPNRGRDVGPFIMAMKEHLSHFDVVGHFHLKGTKQLEQTVVRQWQDFLYDSLLGKHGELANVLLKAFEQDPKLGLCFQEDPCLPSWGKNRELADSLLARLGIDRPTPDIIEYPTGNMFWVRTAALAPLLQQDWQWSDFPAEPVPYDGSILHALERLTPVICEATGFEWATVHNTSAKRYSNLGKAHGVK